MKMFILIFNIPLCEAQQTLPSSPSDNVNEKKKKTQPTKTQVHFC